MNRPELPPEVLRQAAEWFACLADPSAGERERGRWQAWLAASPDHAHAWRRVEAVSRQFSPLAGAGPAARDALQPSRSNQRPVGRRRLLGALAGLFVTGWLSQRMPWADWRHSLAEGGAAYTSAFGEIRLLNLADGGQAWLGSDSALDIDYDPNRRLLSLYRGDLLVDTAPDARPFLVDTPHGRLRAIGTRFAVRVEPAGSRVDVYAGAVEVTPRDAPEAPAIYPAGAHARFVAGTIVGSGRADTVRDGWRRDLLVADGLRLDELVAELTRWNQQAVSCAPDVAGLRVVGAYPLRDPGRVLAALRASLPIEVEDGTHGLRLIARKEMMAGPYAPPRRLD